MFNRQTRKCITFLTVFMMFYSGLYLPTFNQKTYAESETDMPASDESFIRKDLYSQYINEYKNAPKPQSEILIEGEEFAASNDMNPEILTNFEGMNGKAVKTEETGSITWEFDVKEEGLYNIQLKYFPIEGKSSSAERELLINGKVPFQGAATLTFSRSWKNELPEIERDNRGNDLRPRQVEDPIWMEVDLQDSEGYYTEPYLFYFNKGKNSISLVSSREPLLIDYIKLYQVKDIPTYEEVKAEYEKMGYKETDGVQLKIQGEDATLKSAPTLYSINDRTSPSTEPYDISKIRMNTIGGYNWRWPGQWITWKVDVPEDGLYKLGLKYKQNMLRGLFSARKLLINDEVPFKEVENIPFYFHNSWELDVLGGEDPYLFYLPKGTNEIKLEVTLGDVAPLLRTVESSVLELNYIYRKILMVTGAVPDPYRDYQLEKHIPEMTEIFSRQSKILYKVSEELERVTGEKSDQTAILNTMAYQLEDFVKRPETIQRRLDTYKINVGGLGTWILTVREQPLEIDYFVVASPKEKMPKPDATVISKAIHEVGSFFYSFIEDYNSIGNVSDEEDDNTITVWIGTGRDQAQVLKSMIDDTFTPQTNINVNLKLVQMNVLLPATLAGQGPDVAMQIQNDIPVNYAMRNAVADLTQFDDFETVQTRFRDSAVLPFRFNDGVYALPEQQVFSMMFYRKDIFEEYGLKVPETWDELYEILPALQKNHMEMALPLDPPAQMVNLIPNQTFTMMLFQNDGKLYKEKDIGSALDSEMSMEAFKNWTSLYTNYKLPLQFDFPNRFRTGEMPIGIADYTFYNHLSVSAPEIRGLWEFVQIPGTPQNDGTIRREVSSSGTSAILMEQSKNKEASWEFLKWWTSKEVQVRFGREMEGLMGAAARYPTANIEALKELPWPVKDYEQLEKQWQWVRGVPEVPGGYFTGRHLDNAFREVVNNGTNPREALNDFIIYIDDEIRVKRKEFNLPLE
ncbi:extracellular solute-binding protein [Lederbergia wuyishanensis]|uniref:ABC-type glycerol-3-phosphate transport system substrate-binding protein n=1 Tax=Lederbergia wuyishanensis TaxID=1347903 RepID=A0ABU0DA36_9BACI|nr:extracellular solute-binding protein [Lederbergia wuyishanensis]MCJ8009937.1 extracellular solute-binding protein [Lederbergia wuyishanensis]MDQ0345284.1 ABC-type glycerol-3-phosphate transport system substrate-binding protein [Lederbergia wuyishanensis]